MTVNVFHNISIQRFLIDTCCPTVTFQQNQWSIYNCQFHSGAEMWIFVFEYRVPHVGNFEVCVPTHYACSLFRLWPVNCLFLTNRNAELAVPPLFWPVNCMKIGGHVVLLSAWLYCYSLYCVSSGKNDISPREDKIHISAPLRNVLLVFCLLYMDLSTGMTQIRTPGYIRTFQ